MQLCNADLNLAKMAARNPVSILTRPIWMIGQIKQMVEQDGPVIVVSTHAPYVLNEVSPDSVRVVRCGSSGTVVRALTNHPEWAEWDGHMNAGEFWTYVGEEWLEKAE